MVYKFAEVQQNGWKQTGNTTDEGIYSSNVASESLSNLVYSVEVPNDDSATADGLDFGNIPQGALYGAKYFDLNHDALLGLSGSGPFTATEGLILGWPINQGGDASAALTTGSSSTDSNGYPYNFTRTLDPGTYTFSEVPSVTIGWTQTGNVSKQGTTTGGAS